MRKRSAAQRVLKQHSRQSRVEILPVYGLPEFQAGDDLASHIIKAMRRACLRFVNGDVLVLAQKIVSKAESCTVQLASVQPSPKADEIAAKLKKDPRLVEVILREARRIVRSEPIL